MMMSTGACLASMILNKFRVIQIGKHLYSLVMTIIKIDLKKIDLQNFKPKQTEQVFFFFCFVFWSLDVLLNALGMSSLKTQQMICYRSNCFNIIHFIMINGPNWFCLC